MSESNVRPTALVVDDEFLIAVELEATLQDAGYVVLTAVTPAEAHQIVERQKIDVAVLDFRMGSESLELATALRSRSVPFVFCTGALRDEVDARFPGTPMVGKPFTASELLAIIDEIIAAP